MLLCRLRVSLRTACCAVARSSTKRFAAAAASSAGGELARNVAVSDVCSRCVAAAPRCWRLARACVCVCDTRVCVCAVCSAARDSTRRRAFVASRARSQKRILPCPREVLIFAALASRALAHIARGVAPHATAHACVAFVSGSPRQAPRAVLCARRCLARA